MAKMLNYHKIRAIKKVQQAQNMLEEAKIWMEKSKQMDKVFAEYEFAMDETNNLLAAIMRLPEILEVKD